MKNRLYDHICIVILSLLLEILLPSICCTNIVNDIPRIKRSVREILKPKDDINYVKEIGEINLERARNDSDVEKDDTYFAQKRKIFKRSVDSVNTDPQRSIANDSADYDDISIHPSLQCPSEKSDYTIKSKKDEEASNRVRARRDVNADLDKYTDQDERSGLYDDYEAKDVAKRGVLGGPEDYEEVEEEDSPRMLEDMLALQEEDSMLDETQKGETQNDVRVKRYQADLPDRGSEEKMTAKSSKRNTVLNKQGTNLITGENINESKREVEKDKGENEVSVNRFEQNLKSVKGRNSELLDNKSLGIKLESDRKLADEISDSNNNFEVSNKGMNPFKPLYSFNISKTVLSGMIDKTKLNPIILFKIDGTKIDVPDDRSKIKRTDSKEDDVHDASRIDGSTSAISSSINDNLNAEYDRRVEEQIQRKIDAIKEEIQHGLEVQQRIRDIEENNAKFDELLDQEHENEERPSFGSELIDKQQNMAKRSVQEVTNNGIVSSKNSDKKRSLKREKHERLQRRSNGIIKSDTSQGSFKKKREHVRQTILVNNDHHDKKRQSRSYTLPFERKDTRLDDGLPVKRDLSSYLRVDNKMFQAPSPLANEGDVDEDLQNAATVGRLNSLAPVSASSLELSPRLAKEYKEAFGGLQSEPGSVLARFKRIKRVLHIPDSKV